jgi:hypothetical protein
VSPNLEHCHSIKGCLLKRKTDQFLESGKDTLDKPENKPIIGNALEETNKSCESRLVTTEQDETGSKLRPQTCLVGEGADVENTSVFSLSKPLTRVIKTIRIPPSQLKRHLDN